MKKEFLEKLKVYIDSKVEKRVLKEITALRKEIYSALNEIDNKLVEGKTPSRKVSYPEVRETPRSNGKIGINELRDLVTVDRDFYEAAKDLNIQEEPSGKIVDVKGNVDPNMDKIINVLNSTNFAEKAKLMEQKAKMRR